MTHPTDLAELAANPPAAGFKNKIINGNFDIWQRATSFTSSGYGGADRWITLNTGTTHTTSRQSFTPGQTDVPNEPAYYQRTVVTSSAGAANYAVTYQKIESVRTLAGQKATLSFWAKADASKNIAVEFGQIFGTGGSPSSDVTGIDVTTCSLTTSWQKLEITVDIPSISGKTLGTTNDGYLTILFWFDAGSNFNARTNSLGQQSGTFDIAQVQLEAGPVATPFEHRLPGVELSLCLRYYEVIYYQILSIGYGTSGFTYYSTSRFSPKRASPSATFGNHGTNGFNGTRTVNQVSNTVITWQDVCNYTGNGTLYSYCYIILDAEL